MRLGIFAENPERPYYEVSVIHQRALERNIVPMQVTNCIRGDQADDIHKSTKTKWLANVATVLQKPGMIHSISTIRNTCEAVMRASGQGKPAMPQAASSAGVGIAVPPFAASEPTASPFNTPVRRDPAAAGDDWGHSPLHTSEMHMAVGGSMEVDSHPLSATVEDGPGLAAASASSGGTPLLTDENLQRHSASNATAGKRDLLRGALKTAKSGIGADGESSARSRSPRGSTMTGKTTAKAIIGDTGAEHARMDELEKELSFGENFEWRQSQRCTVQFKAIQSELPRCEAIED